MTTMNDVINAITEGLEVDPDLNDLNLTQAGIEVTYADGKEFIVRVERKRT